MLALDDKRWSLLGHAYGKADGIPKMILELKQLSKIDFENDLLYSFLFHQNTTYSATCAAVPHIAEIAFQENQTIENKTFLVAFCGEVHVLRYWDKEFYIRSDDQKLVNELTFQIRDAYSKAIRKIELLVERFLVEKILDDCDRYYMFYIFLAFEGFENLSKIFIPSNFTEFNFYCPNCEYEHLIEQDGSKMILNTEDSDFELNPIEIKLKNLTNAPSKERVAEWILFYAEKYDVKPVKYQIPYLFGSMICPNCDKNFKIIDALSQDFYGSNYESF